MFDQKEKLEKLFIRETDPIIKAVDVIDKAGNNCTKIALVVDQNYKLLGIINDGDIRRALLKGLNLNLNSSEIMTKSYKFVNDGDSRTKAIDLMKSFSITQVPVLNRNKQVVGIHFINDFLSTESIENLLVIMAGGKGTRLRPITENIPKPMIPVAGKPILEHLINHAVGHGIKNICLTINYKGHIIEEYFGNGENFGCNISYIKETKPLGSAGALSLLENANDDIILMNGDLVTQVNLQKMIKLHNKKNNYVTVAARDHVEKISYGVLETQNDKVINLKEKPETHFLVNAGIYILNKEIINSIPKNTEYFATDIINTCLSENRNVGYYLLDEDWADVGEHDQLKMAITGQ